MMQQLIQISDCHLAQRSLMNGVNTRMRLKHIIKNINNKPYDALIATGDLVNTPSAKNYQLLTYFLMQLKRKNISIIAGNHDDINLMRAYLMPYIMRTISLDNWCIILTDSVVDKQVYGMLSAKELMRLEREIIGTTKPYVFIALHHPIVKMNSTWNDMQSLHNAKTLLALLKNHPKVKAVSFGHSHEYKVFNKSGLRIYSCPSSAKQFTHYRSYSSAYMIFKLLDSGNIDHKVIWI